MTVDWSVARTMAGLKFRIIGHTPRVLFGMALGLLLGGGLAALVSATVVAIQENPNRGSMVVTGATGLLLLWLLGPLVLGGGELILDLRSLSLYPINLNTLIAGLLLAASIGVPALLTVIVAGSTLSHASGPASATLLAAAVVLYTLTAVLAGRFSVAAVSVLTTTRFRTVAGGITVLAAITLGVSSQFLALAVDDIDPQWFDRIRAVARILPVGWAPEAMARASHGQLGWSLLFLGLGAGFAMMLLGLWRLTLGRQVDGKEAHSRPRPAKPLVAPWMDRLLDRRTAAAWAKSSRAIRRDVREWTEIAAFLPLILAFSLPTIVEFQARDPRLVLGTFLAAVSGATMTSTNLFGGDGPRFTADAIPGDDFRPILLGKLLPRMILVAAIVIAGTVLLAWIMDGWSYLLLSVLLVLQSLFLGGAAGLFVTIRAPIALPDKIGGFNAANAGCLAPIFQLSALMVADIVAILLAVPALVVALIWDPWTALLGPLVTLPASWWLVKRRLAAEARRTRRRIPEIAAALTNRT